MIYNIYGKLRFKGRLLPTVVYFSVVKKNPAIFIAKTKNKNKKLSYGIVWMEAGADATDHGGMTIMVGMEVMRSSVDCDLFRGRTDRTC